jgi:hypothetical protein
MNGPHLSFGQIVLLTAYAGGMVSGQFLFKMAALQGPPAGPLLERLSAVMLNGFFAAAVLLYTTLDIEFHAVVTGLRFRRVGLRSDALAGCDHFRGTDLGETCCRCRFNLLRSLVCRRVSLPWQTTVFVS